MSLIEGLFDTGRVALEMTLFWSLIKMERNQAMQHLTRQVQLLSPQQLDAYESDFLQKALFVIDGAQRIRAMGLYSWLKLQEYVHYGQFRGYCYDAGTL